jgi:OFA family oxalate/formate antiporter-like MFS transporter
MARQADHADGVNVERRAPAWPAPDSLRVMMNKREEFRQNWRVLLAAVAGLLTGVLGFPLYLIGPFLPHYHEAFGWSATAISLASTSMGAGIFFTSPVTGALTDRFGVRKVALSSLPAIALCFLGLSYLSSSILMLYILYFIIGSLGSGTGPVTYCRAISGWFHKSRGFALGVALAGTGLASALAPLLVQLISSAEGWRMAWRIMALLTALSWPVIFWGLKEPPNDHPDLVAGKPSGDVAQDIDAVSLPQALRGARFYVLAFSGSALALFTPQLIVHFVPSMMERGMSSAAAAETTSLLGVAMIVSRLGTGWLLDRVFAPFVAFAAFAAGAAGCAAFALIGAPAAVPMILSMGLLVAAEVDLMSFLTARYFGLTHFGRIFGLAFAIYTCASLFSPVVVTPLRALGGYEAMYLASALSFAIGAVSFLFLGRYRRE